MLYFSIVLLLLVAGATWNFKYQLQKLKEAHEEELRREKIQKAKKGRLYRFRSKK